MPRKPGRPCMKPGCPNLARGGRFCEEHQKAYDQAYEAQRKSSAARGYDASWQRLRKMILSRHPLCADPFGEHEGRPVPAQEVDHIVPLRKGGGNRSENLQALCKSCHSKKTAREDGRWG